MASCAMPVASHGRVTQPQEANNVIMTYLETYHRED